MDDLNQRLMAAKKHLRLRQKVQAMLVEAEDVVRAQHTKCDRLEQKLADEKGDVERLENISLVGLFHSVMGSKPERLDKERQEFMAAKLKHDEALKSLEEAQQDVQHLRRRLETLASARAEYEQLLAEKERVVAGAGGEHARKLMELSEWSADLSADCDELQEAIDVGQAAREVLEQVRSELRSAADWGTWDLVGGGMFSTIAKHAKIGAAKQQAQRAQRRLQEFRVELADADRRLHVRLEFGGFLEFIDLFFDGLIADWVVQSKIQKATAACSSTICQVASAVDECKRRLQETRQQINDVHRRRNQLIEQV